MASFTTGFPYTNDNLHSFDRIIVFFSYDGLKNGICRSTTSTNNKSFATLFGNSLGSSRDDNNNDDIGNGSAQAAADAINAKETQSAWQLILTQVNSLQQRLQTFRREVSQPQPQPQPQPRIQSKLTEEVDFEY